MLHFQYTSLIDAPVALVWEFHQRPDALQILTPPWQPVTVQRREGGLEIGGIFELAIGLRPLSWRWVARHTECIPYQLFTDEQIEGPLEFWVHRHQFTCENGKTRLTDAIRFGLPGGEGVESLLAEWADARLGDMFCYRHEVTQRECQERKI